MHKSVQFLSVYQINDFLTIERMFMDSTSPACPCRACGQPMDRYFQPSLLPGRPALAFVTCWEQACAMEGFTLGEQDYATLDLSNYIGHRPKTAAAFVPFV